MTSSQDRFGRRAPFGDDYAFAGDGGPGRSDWAASRRQGRALSPSRHRASFERSITDALQRRRSTRGDLVQFDVLRNRRSLVAVVRGVLLLPAEAEQDTGVMAMLEPFAFVADRPEQLHGRLLRLRNDSVPVDQLEDLARLVRAHGIQASVAHIVPLGPLIKGQGGPEPTSVRPVYPPAFVGGRTAAPAVVAVVDTGIAAAPRDDGWLTGIDNGSNTDPLDALPAPDGLLDFAAGHGTFAAGVVQQLAPQATLRVYRAVDSDGVGSEVDVAFAMVQAAGEGAGVINLSLGAETIDDQPLLAVQIALDILSELFPEVLVVAAAGNTGATRPVWPAADRRVLSVGALEADLRPTTWSSRGSWVDCSTVGAGVVSTYVVGTESAVLDPDPDTWVGPDPWAVWSGTSFAAPQLAGAVARLCGETDGLTPRQALARLLAGAPRLPDFGRVVPLLPGS